MAKASIVNKRDVVSFDPRRAGAMDVEVTYTIDGQGPFVVLVPSESYSAAQVRKVIEAKLREWDEIVGQEITTPVTPRKS